MIDKEQIAIMIKDIERYLSDLSEMSISDEKDLERKEAYYAVSMVVFAVMNRVIDIGNEIISGSRDIPLPASYGDTFEILAKNRIISEKVSGQMIQLMRFRNIIAHEYYTLSKEEVLKLKKDMPKVKGFLDEIRSHLKTVGSR